MDFKSFARGVIFVFIYMYATLGIVKLFWNTNDYEMLEGRVKFITLALIPFNLIMLIVPYHILSRDNIVPFYWGLIWFNIIYVVLGSIIALFKEEK